MFGEDVYWRNPVMTFFLKCRFLVLVLAVTGGGYHAGRSPLSRSVSTITVPYVKGDTDGSLTAALIERISATGIAPVVQEGGRLVVHVLLHNQSDDNIGFQYERDIKGALLKTLVANESRMYASARVTVVESSSGTVLLGPASVSAAADFSFIPDGSSQSPTAFSLGQMEPYGIAREAAKDALNDALAEKIANLVVNGW